jgi:sugar O-acyltransferase (sialic acid O-acetyltransferase NeuD family)|tara:strand:+ start:1242 stop:1913 length:672 start_codon:yes stop_codon:yes gene_type:complete
MKLVCLGAVPEAIRIIQKIQKMNSDFELIGFLDNDESKWGQKVFSYPIFGGMSSIPELRDKGYFFCNLITHDAISRYETTLELIKQGVKLTNLIHPSVDLDLVKTGLGNYIQENVVLQANVSLGDNSSIHFGTLVSHETKIGNSCFIAPGCNLSGAVDVGDGVFMGTGVTIMPKINIGKWSVIGAGSVVIKDIPPYSKIVGNPSRVIGSLDKKYDNGKIFNKN